MRFAIAAVTALCCAFGAAAHQFHGALFSEPAPSEMQLEDMFTSFRLQYSKDYSHEELSSRYLQFKTNVETIRMHNTLANSSYTMGLNQFADLSIEEFKAKYLGYSHVAREYSRTNNLHQEVEAAPVSVDWRSKNAVTAIKDQGGTCSSDWAFSATGALEGAWVLQAGGSLVSLSEQQLVDCDYGSQGCYGGGMDLAFKYVISNKGICTESAYPYTGVESVCKTSCSKVVTISGYNIIEIGSESALLNAVGTIGPVSVAVDASNYAFISYKSGIFSGPCGTNINHGVLIVGYGTAGTQDYWIVKNSWDTDWGEAGYMRMIRGQNLCGITLEASYPTV